MCIAPKPSTSLCPECGWKVTRIHLSDALTEGYDVFRACPECGCSALTRRPATRIETFLERMRGGGDIRKRMRPDR